MMYSISFILYLPFLCDLIQMNRTYPSLSLKVYHHPCDLIDFHFLCVINCCICLIYSSWYSIKNSISLLLHKVSSEITSPLQSLYHFLLPSCPFSCLNSSSLIFVLLWSLTNKYKIISQIFHQQVF